MQQDLGEFSSQNFTHFASKVRMFIVVGLLYIIHMTPFPSQEMPGSTWWRLVESVQKNSKLP